MQNLALAHRLSLSSSSSLHPFCSLGDLLLKQTLHLAGNAHKRHKGKPEHSDEF